MFQSDVKTLVFSGVKLPSMMTDRRQFAGKTFSSSRCSCQMSVLLLLPPLFLGGHGSKNIRKSQFLVASNYGRENRIPPETKDYYEEEEKNI